MVIEDLLLLLEFYNKTILNPKYALEIQVWFLDKAINIISKNAFIALMAGFMQGILKKQYKETVYL